VEQRIMTANKPLDAYNASLIPVLHLLDYDKSQMLDVVRVAKVFTSGMREILNDLTYDEGVFDELLAKLDDNYDEVLVEYEQLKTYANKKVVFEVDNLLTQLAKLQEEISVRMANERYAS
jgi:hypothetical protein